MADLIPIRRALLSVSDKTGLLDFATALHNEFGIELISTGGTAKFLRETGKLPVTDVSDVTGFPEMMDGRVKTLHPKIHGGLLALRDNAEHVAAMNEHDIRPIDLVCINLYPFQQTIGKPGVTFEEAIENIDIGGPSMIRSAAKNHRFVLVVTSPDRYEKVLGDLREHGGSSCGKHRLKQSQRAFQHTAEYDALIAKYLRGQIDLPGRSQTGGGPGRFRDEPHEGGIATAAPEEAARGISRSKLVMRLNQAGDTQSFVNDVLTTQAVVVAGTEAAAFVVERAGADFVLKPITHIRPDESDVETRRAAIHAFQEIIRPCAQNNKDGAIEVGGSEAGRANPQFCLVTLLRSEGEVVAATAVITRCRDLDAAQQCLVSTQLVAGYFDLRPDVWARSTWAGTTGTEPLPNLGDSTSISLTKKQDLRYGENPHQKAALYVDRKPNEASVAYARQLHGKELSYINLLDADGALAVVKEFATPAACIVKHATPCGCATADNLPKAFRRAYEGDSLAAFGGIVAMNRTVDLQTALAITSIDKLLEVIVAPDYADDALQLLRERWKNVRLLAVGAVVRGLGVSPEHSEKDRSAQALGRDAQATQHAAHYDRQELHLHKIVGGWLVQERDLLGLDEANWKVVSERHPTDTQWQDLRFAWLVCKHVKSNAIALAKDQMLIGAGAGQQDRVSAARIAIGKAQDRASGAVAASDAFFPFPDGPQLLLDAGVTAIIQPGGSQRDQETIDIINRAGAAMVFTSQRHFKH